MTITKGKVVPVSAVRDPERAILVGAEVRRPGRRSWTLEDSVAELAALTASAGADVVGTLLQRLHKPTHVYVGKGKLQEIRDQLGDLRATTVILDDELSPAQQRNLEEALAGAKVLDRTALILDIFAQRANTKEGRLQVELAQHQYLLPRLVGQWSHLERLGGGIGTRGPGESQLETDRRLARQRIHRLQKDLDDVRRRRAHYRGERQQRGLPAVSLIGYTNAGKSTLMNALTGSKVRAENRMFATLDPTTRRIVAEDVPLLLTDTVGFVQKLPADLVAAFRATLEEVVEADLLIHVVDACHPMARQQAAVVVRALRERGADQPMVTILNKVDRLQEGALMPEVMDSIDSTRPIALSALHRHGFDELRAALAQAVRR